MFTGQEMEEIWRINSTLTVTDISATDGGNYTCIAENEAGAVGANARLLVRLYTNESLVLQILTTTERKVPIFLNQEPSWALYKNVLKRTWP